jgi:urea transport system ATP-binding protein
MGRNGVGKTTLVKCLMGLLPLKGGRVVFKGMDVTALPPESRARLGMGYVPQGRQIFPLLTVEENLKTGLAARRGSTKGVPEAVYGHFPVLRDMLGRRGGDLSGGQQQQLAVARALVLEPELLLLDEPTEGIQPNVSDEIVRILARLASAGTTVLHVEQKVPVARKAGDDYAIMERGAVVDSGRMAGLTEKKIRSFLSV